MAMLCIKKHCDGKFEPRCNKCEYTGWVNVKDGKPKDDQNVFVINNRVQMLPIKAYYCEEWDEFMSLENGDGTNHPLSVTHWMCMPANPK